MGLPKSADAFAQFPAGADLRNLAVVLVRPRNPLNIGAVARAMSNFGCADLRLVAVHAPSYESAGSAVGPARELLRRARCFDSLGVATEDCSLVCGTLAPHGRLPEQPMEPLATAVERLRAAMQNSRVAIVFGSEKHGLTNHDFSYCHAVLGIPSQAAHASMNLGQAAAVCLYAIAHAPINASAAVTDELPLASAGDVDRITELLSQALAAANYAGIGRPWGEDHFRALVRRMRIPEQDAPALTGMLRKILYVLENKKHTH